MSVKVAKNRFIDFSLQKFGALYQHLFSGVSDFQKLGDKLVQEANRAQAFRHAERIEEVAIVLSNFPIKEYQLIGQYYMGWADYLRGERPRKIFEKVAEQSHWYKAKGLISLAVIEAHRGDYTSELAYYNEALKCANNPSTKIDILRAIATVKAKEGFNKQSLKDLENILPLARYGHLKVYHDYLNSYAVELAEAGRIEEAQSVCRITLASPYAFAYPEWRETGQDLALRGYKSRSSVRVKHPGNIAYLPEPSPATGPPVKSESARVLSIKEWKKKMGKDGEDKIDPQKMSERELLLKIIELSSNDSTTENELRQILAAIVKITNR